jgi:hypothetical protein
MHSPSLDENVQPYGVEWTMSAEMRRPASPSVDEVGRFDLRDLGSLGTDTGEPPVVGGAALVQDDGLRREHVAVVVGG